MVGGVYGTPRVGVNFKWGGGGVNPTLPPPPFDFYDCQLNNESDTTNKTLFIEEKKSLYIVKLLMFGKNMNTYNTVKSLINQLKVFSM